MSTPEGYQPNGHVTNDSARDHILFVAKGSAVGLVGRLVARLLLIAFSPIIARILGASGLGILGLGMTMLLVASTLASMGIPTGIVRYLPIYLDRWGIQKAAALAARATLLGFLVGLAAGLTLWKLAPWLAVVLRKPEASMVMKVIAFALPFGVLRLSLASVATARHNAIYQNLSDIARVSFTMLLVIFGAWLFGLGLHGAIWAIALAEMLSVLPALIGVPKVLGITLGSFFGSVQQPISLRQFVLFCLPVTLIQLSQLGIYHINVILGARWLDHINLGIYTAAAQLATVGTLGLAAVGDIFRPSAAALHDRSAIKEMRAVFHSATRWVYYLVMPVMVFMFVLPTELLSLFGKDFSGGALALQILCLGQIINASTGNVGHLLVMSGYQWLNLLDNMAMMTLNILLCLWLAPSWGILGVAVAASAGIALVNLLRAVQAYQCLRISPFHWEAFKVFLAAWVAALALLIPFQGFLLRFVMGLLLYPIAFFLALWLQGFPEEDKALFLHFFSRSRATIPASELSHTPKPRADSKN